MNKNPCCWGKKAAILLWLFCLALPVLLSAQSFRKTIKTCRRPGDHLAALAVFARFKDHPKHGPAARYFCAKIQLRQALPLAALLEWNKALLDTETRYGRLPAKRAKKTAKKYGVDTVAIQDLREQTQRLALAQVRVRGTFSALDSLETGLLQPFPVLQAAIDSTHSDIVQAHLETKDYDVMTLIVQKHLRWVKPEHYRLTRRLYNELWPAFQEKYPLCELDRYARDHPQSFVGRDCWHEEVRQLFCRGDANALLDFQAQNPWTAMENTVLSAILEKPPVAETLDTAQAQHLKDLRRRAALREALRTGAAAKDTAAALREAKYYIVRYAPRFTAFKLLEESLQFFLERHLYHSAAALLSESRPYFPDTLPAGCHTNFSFQVRVRPYINGKLPILSKPAAQLQRRPLEDVNTEQGDESNPVLSADASTLYFAGADRPDNVASGQDVFVSRRRADGGWSKPELVAALSGPGDQVPLSVTADGNQLLLSVNGKLFLSQRINGHWGRPEKLPVSGIALIGKGFLSANGDILVLEGSYETGGALQAPDQDLFVAFREKAGQWSRPFALGSDINTDEQEGAPFLSADGKTLYFVTDGYPGLGRSDVFVAHRRSDKWTEWTRPENLGKEINDTYPHSGFSGVTADGGLVYFTIYGETGGKGDIWENTLPR